MAIRSGIQTALRRNTTSLYLHSAKCALHLFNTKAIIFVVGRTILNSLLPSTFLSSNGQQELKPSFCLNRQPDEKGRRESKIWNYRLEESTCFGKKTSDANLWNEVTPTCLVPLSTALQSRSMQLLSQFGLPETRHSESRYNKFTKVLQDLVFPLYRNAATVPCYTDPVTASVPQLRPQSKNRFCTFPISGLIVVKHIWLWPSPFSKEPEFGFLREKNSNYFFSPSYISCSLKNGVRTNISKQFVELCLQRSP